MDKLANSIVKIQYSKDDLEAVGAGFFITSTGYILTCQHVINTIDKNEIWVSWYEQIEPCRANYNEVLSDPADRKDFAIIKVDPSPNVTFPPLLEIGIDCKPHDPVSGRGFQLSKTHQHPAIGKIIGDVTGEKCRYWLAGEAFHVDRGLSGAPARNDRTNKIFGVFSEQKIRTEDIHERGVIEITDKTALILPIDEIAKELLNRNITDISLTNFITDVILSTYQKTSLFSKAGRIADFTGFIDERTKHFVGREYVIKEIDDAIADLDFPSGYIIIKGEPGIGKTTLVAWLVKQRDYLSHFNSSILNIRTTHHFMANICAQLIDRYNLDYESLPKELDESNEDYDLDGGIFCELLNKASEKEKGDLLIIIDALDEVNESGLPATANTLLLPEILPIGVYIILTTREKKDEKLYVDRRKDIVIIDKDPRNLRDMKSYIDYYIKTYPTIMMKLIKDLIIDKRQFIEILVKKSEGNFKYLYHVLSDFREGKMCANNIDSIENIPIGLKAYYQRHWRSMKDLDINRYHQLQRPILCYLAIAFEPISINVLREWTDLDSLKILEIIKEWHEFLNHVTSNQGEPLFHVYHKSFAEFLNEEERLSEFHGGIADITISKIDEQNNAFKAEKKNPYKFLTLYELNHIAKHVIKAPTEKLESIEKMLTNLEFVEAKCSAGMTVDLMRDYESLSAISDEIDMTLLNEWKNFLASEIEHFRHYAQTIPQIVFQQAYNTPHYPNIAKAAKDMETAGKGPEKPWFCIYEMEPEAISNQTLRGYRKWIDYKKQQGYQYLTSLSVLNNEHFASGYLDGWLGIWEISSGIQLHYFQAHSWNVHCIIPIDNSIFASGGNDGIIKFWDIKEGVTIRELRGHTSKILCMVKWNEDCLISGSSDSTIGIWNIKEENSEPIFCKGHSGPVVDLQLLWSNIFISISNDNTILIWMLPYGELLCYSNQYTENAQHEFTISPDNKVYSAGVSGILFWGSLKAFTRKSKFPRWMRKKEISPQMVIRERCDWITWIDKHRALIGNLSKIKIVNVHIRNSNVVKTSKNMDWFLGMKKIDSRTAISYNQYGDIWRWDLPNLEPIKIINIPNGRPNLVASINQKQVLIGTELTEEVYLVDLYPDKIREGKYNFIVKNEPDPSDYQAAVQFRRKGLGQKESDNITDREIIYILFKEMSAYQGISITNNRRYEWRRAHDDIKLNGYFEIQHNILYYKVKEEIKAIFFGSVHSCVGTSRSEIETVRGWKIWMELKNPNS